MVLEIIVGVMGAAVVSLLGITLINFHRSVDGLKSHMERSFDKMEERMEKRSNELEARMEKRSNELEERMEKRSAELEARMEERSGKLEASLSALWKEHGNLKVAHTGLQGNIDTLLRVLTSQFASQDKSGAQKQSGKAGV